MNLAAFHWGRRAALDRDAVEALARPAPERATTRGTCRRSFEEIVERRVHSSPPIRTQLMRRAIAAWSSKVKAAEAAKAPGKCGLAEAVARYLFKLMAYKDEYEVARLYTDGTFLTQVAERARRRQPALRIPSRAAAFGATRSVRPAAAQDELRSVDDARVPAARELQVPARHAVRSSATRRSAAPRAS